MSEPHFDCKQKQQHKCLVFVVVEIMVFLNLLFAVVFVLGGRCYCGG